MSPNGIVGIESIEEIGKEVSKVIVAKAAKDLYMIIKDKAKKTKEKLKSI